MLRTKLTSDASELVLDGGRDETPQTLEMRREASSQQTTATSPSPGREVLVGLGMGLEEEMSGGEGATQTAAAEDQARRLLALPMELHQALARLSSQHQ